MITRGAFNEIIPGKIYQRGQIYTWTLEKKRQAFEEHGITAVLNLWPKTDPEMACLNLDWYMQLYCPRSEETLRPAVLRAAEYAADWVRAGGPGALLVLCEAGKTRSVFFCILTVAKLNHITFAEAKALVLAAVARSSLKGFMEDWIQNYSGGEK